MFLCVRRTVLNLNLISTDREDLLIRMHTCAPLPRSPTQRGRRENHTILRTRLASFSLTTARKVSWMPYI